MRIVSYLIAALLASGWSINLAAQKTPTSKAGAENTSRVIGRVLAWKETLLREAGVGPQHVVFIFGVETDGGVRVTPIKVAYAFFKSDGPPPDSFFDHSKLYELQAVRDPRCDEKASDLSYEQSTDETGKPLPPRYVLRFLDGASKDVLKPHAVLPCYILYCGHYKIVSQGKESKIAR
jgi:hypothetical protein